jgi:thiamine-phosphate pyrophosphorylase
MTNSEEITTDLYRLIDANLNRLKEGIRVVEDVARYLQNNKSLAKQLKTIRHEAKLPFFHELLNARDASNDVMRPTIASENSRDDLQSIMIANYKRAQESSRVLEESLKLIDSEAAERFKGIRYALYTLEKDHIGNL